jgi:hypothetical protein
MTTKAAEESNRIRITVPASLLPATRRVQRQGAAGLLSTQPATTVVANKLGGPMTIITPEPALTKETVSFPHFFTLCGVPQPAIDAVWEANMISEWSDGDPIPAAPSLEVAEMLAVRQSSLRTLGVAMRDAAWLAKFAAQTILPGREGLALNPLLPDAALTELQKKAPHLVQERIDARAMYAAHQTAPHNAAAVASALIEARDGVQVSEVLNAGSSDLADALRAALIGATGGPRSHAARTVRAALILTGCHDDLLVATAADKAGIVDTAIVGRLSELVQNGVIPREALRARAHADAIGMARRLGLSEIAPRRATAPITKEAQAVLDQFSIFVTIDPTPAARRAIRWWTSLEAEDVNCILDAADVETIVDWCQGAMQVAPDAEEVVALLSRLGAEKYDEFCDEVTRRPDPTEENPVLSLALREPLKNEWRPAAIHAAVGHLCDELTDENHWHTAIALLANGWKPTMWELAGCAKQI